MSRRIANGPALLQPTPSEARNGATMGRVCDLDASGTVWVDFAGNAMGPLPARRIGVIDDAALRGAQRSGADVVLVFEDGDPLRPLVLSICAPPAASASGDAPRPEPTARGSLDPAPQPGSPAPDAELLIDGRRLVLQGTERIELRCGDASIVLCADGTLKLRGRDIASLARRRQRIKGGTVAIN